MQSRIDAENRRECSDEPCQGGARSNSDDGDDHEEPESTVEEQELRIRHEGPREM